MYRQEGNKVYRKIFDGENFLTQVREFKSEDEAAAFINSGEVEMNTVYVS